jgi:hypothetical protein
MTVGGEIRERSWGTESVHRMKEADFFFNLA